MRQLSIVALQISTLSILSGGRLILGVGVGGEWPKEWAAAGIPLKERGARLDEMIPLLRRLFAGETIDFEGRFNTLPGVTLSPMPPPIPIYFAGRVPAAIQRAAKFGDGWLGFSLSLNGFKRDTALINQARERADRADKPFKFGMSIPFLFDKNDEDADLRAALALNEGFPPELRLTPPEKLRRFLLAGTPARVTEQIQGYIEAGCEIFSLSPIARGQAFQEHLDIFASEVLPRIKTSSW